MNEPLTGTAPGGHAGPLLGPTAWPAPFAPDALLGEDVARLVAAANREEILDAILALMEGRGLGCPHVYLADDRRSAYRIVAERAIPESYRDEIERHLAMVAAGEAMEDFVFLPNGLRHGVVAVRERGELLGVLGWLQDEGESPAPLGPFAPLIGAALTRLFRGAAHRRRRSEREAARRAVLAVGEARDLSTMLDAIAERARLLTGAAQVAVREVGVEPGPWVVRGPSQVSAPRPEAWPYRISIRHQGRQLAEIRIRPAENGARPTREDLRLAALFAEHVGALVAWASARSQLMREVSEQARLVEWLRSLVEHLPVATLLVHGAPGKETVLVNRRGRSLLACEAEVGLERVLPLLLADDGRPFPSHVHPISRILRGESILRLEAQICPTEENAPRSIVFHGEPIEGCSNSLAAVIALEDVTAFKTLERMREQWASIVTHDLRQPLTSIVGFASLLAREEDLSPAIRTKLEAIGSAARRLVRISRDLLDVTAIDAHQLELDRRRIDLAALARGLAAELSRESDSLPIRILADPDLPLVDVDPVRIEQVLENLLTNARKYGREGSVVLVRVERGENEVRVHVHNEGEGLEPDELLLVFQRFFRGQNARRGNKPGVGLGLYIARSLVEAHGGRIWASCVPGQEVVFSFALPI